MNGHGSATGMDNFWIWFWFLVFGNVTHHTDAHLAHGTSRTSSFIRGFFASLAFFFALSYPGMFTLAGGGIPIRRSTVECAGCFLLYAFFPQHLF